MSTQEGKDFQGRRLHIDKDEKWTRWPKNYSVSWSIMPIAYILVFYLIQVEVYEMMVLYHINHVIQACFKIFFSSELKFVNIYFHPVINNCIFFHDGHACFLCVCAFHIYIYTQLLECLARLSVLLQTNIKNRHNLILKESYFLLQSKECKI